MTKSQRKSAWFVETTLILVARAEILPVATIRRSLANLRTIAGDDPNPTSGGALLRICDALEGVCEDKP